MGSKKPKTYEHKIYPGYVMVKMIMTDKTWYVVRNTSGVTGFVGPGSKPIPLTDEEVAGMGIERIQLKLDVEIGEEVRIMTGPFNGFTGKVLSIDPENQEVKLLLKLFMGKESSIDLKFTDIQKL